MTDCLNTPVVTVPLMVTIGTGTNAGYLDFNIDPEDLNPPDDEFWEDKEGFEWWHWDPSHVPKIRWQSSPRHIHLFPNPSTKAHAKMLIHLLTGRADLWNPPKDRSTMPVCGQEGETT